MKPTLMRSLFVVAVLASTALAQTNPAPSSSALPSAPSAAAAPANDPAPIALNLNAKVAAINIEQVIFLTNEGQRELETLGKKFEPKRNELNNRRSEIDALKKQATAASATAEQKTELQRQVDQKQKGLEREAQDAQEDFNAQQQEIANRLLQKIGPVIMKYAQDNGIGMIVDTSAPWPNGPVLYSAPMDVTKPIVDIYNTQSGVPAPARTTTPPGNARPGGLGGAGTGTSKPATNPTTKPPATQPKQ